MNKRAIIQNVLPYFLFLSSISILPAAETPKDEQLVADEHALIGVEAVKETQPAHTLHPDAQWYPDAGLGLFIHWGLSSVRSMNISWPMIPGRPLGTKRIEDPDKIARIIRESDYNLNGKPPEITPNEYWSMAKDFNPRRYDPDKWFKASKEAGFKYAVLTARHHEGFALWPSDYGDFNTKNYMGGRDLVKEFVEACRRNGLKVGLYYSPPDWYFDRDYMNFLYYKAVRLNPEIGVLGPDLKPRTSKKSQEEIARHQAEYREMVRGQVRELLTRYGTIDLLWFDGKPPIPNGNQCITIDEIRQLQAAIVVNPRLHGKGDFVTYERNLTTDKVAQGWAEFCNTWTTCWAHMDIPFRANGYVLGQFVTSRSLGINYLLGVGPTASGEFCDGIYQNMAVLGEWMEMNGAAVEGTRPLPEGESASVPATASRSVRYLFALPEFRNNGAYEKDLLDAVDCILTLHTCGKVIGATLLSDGVKLAYHCRENGVTIELPAARRTRLVDVVRVELD